MINRKDTVMGGIGHIGEMEALALHAVGLVAAREAERLSAGEIAGLLSASQHTTRLVMGRLVKGGILASTRGPSGGFGLAQPAESLTLWLVIAALGGVDADRCDCLFKRRLCEAGAACPFIALTRDVNGAVRKYLQQTSVADLCKVFTENDGKIA